MPLPRQPQRSRGTATALAAVALSLACAPVLPSRTPPAPPASAAAAGCRAAVDADAGRRTDIDWIVAAGTEDRWRLDEWCAGVGPAVVASRVAAPTGSVDSLLIVTWNTHIGGGDLGGFVQDLRRGVHTGGAPVEHFVLLLQEVRREGGVPAMPVTGARHARRFRRPPDEGARADVVAASRRLALDLVYVPGIRTGGAGDRVPEDRGTAILSSLPLEAPGAIELPHERHRRVAAMALVRTGRAAAGAEPLRVVSVHLDNRSRLGRWLATFGGARLRQAIALEAALPDDEPVALGGDLNSWSLDALEEAPRFLHRHFPDGPADGPPTFSAAGLVQRRLDYLFFRLTEGTTGGPITLSDRYGSDHHPVMSWVWLLPSS